MKILCFAGSLRRDSLNKLLSRWSAQRINELYPTSEAIYVDLQPLGIPLYDGDIEAQGIPAGVQTLTAQVVAADALLISSPEYNASISSVLKNTLDWLSRVKPMPLAGKPALLLSASPGGLGGVRGLWHSRQTFAELGMHLMPQMIGVGQAHTKLTPDGAFNDAVLQKKLEEAFAALVSFAQALKKS